MNLHNYTFICIVILRGKVKNMENEALLMKKFSEVAEKNSEIDTSLYQKYDVKRGLRHSDGRGVLVGLTKIGDVIGYDIIDGKKVPIPGRLVYRGYNIEDLIADAESRDEFGFEQTIYLLLFGELPTRSELAAFCALLEKYRVLPDNFIEDMIMKAPSDNIMNKLARTVLAAYSYDSNAEDVSIENNLRQCITLIAQFSTIAAYAYQAKNRYYHGKSMYIHNPKEGLSTSENLLRLIRPNKAYSRLEADILDLSLILHAEHGGGNNSSFSVHVISSSDTDTYSAISAAVGSLKGRRHGGANAQVIEMMENIKANVKDWSNETQVKDYLRKIVKKEAGDKTGLIYGQGHAVYTVSDPRAVLLGQKAEKLAIEKGALEEYGLYRLVEKYAPIVLAEEKASDKQICSNVDFFSGFVYNLLGIPSDLFTPLFAVSRIAGWAAHRMEEVIAGGRIYRPAYKNILDERSYIPIDKR